MDFFKLPPLHSVWGQHIDDVFWLSYYLTGIAFLAVCGILIFCCVAYRDRPGHRAEYFHGDSKVHMAVTAALSALVFLGLDYQLESRGRRAMQLYKDGFALAEQHVRIQVRGEQFKWYMRYPGPDGEFGGPDDVVSTSLKVPVGTPVAVQITSKDVIHSFYLPFQRIKQDAVPGIVTTAWFQAEELSPEDNTWQLGCAELCGSGHTNMNNPFEVMTRDRWEAWLRSLHEEEVAEEDWDMGEQRNDDDTYTNWGWKWETRGKKLPVKAGADHGAGAGH